MTKVRGLFIHPGQADEIASRHPLIGRYQIVVTRKEDKDQMTFRIEFKVEAAQRAKLKEEIEKSIRDVMKLRGDVEILPGGTIPENAKRIDDQRSWE